MADENAGKTGPNDTSATVKIFKTTIAAESKAKDLSPKIWGW
jgi:hypothetical protein